MSIGNGNFGVSELGGFQVLLVNGSGSGRKIVAGAFYIKVLMANQERLFSISMGQQWRLLI